MKELKEKILAEGRALSSTVLKVDSFLNHAVDVNLMYKIGTEFKEYFKEHKITKIFTIESSGIAPTAMTALQMELPMVTLKKQTSKILKNDIFQTTVHSFTKGTDYELTLSKNYINEEDRVLIIDDFLKSTLSLPYEDNLFFATSISFSSYSKAVILQFGKFSNKSSV